MKPSINLDSLKAESLASPRILIPLAIVLVLIVVGLILPLLKRARRADKKAADGGTEILLGPPQKFAADNIEEWAGAF